MKQHVSAWFISAWLLSVALTLSLFGRAAADDRPRCRARESGVVVGILAPGPLNAIHRRGGRAGGPCHPD